jgi:hypothetical protein
MAVGLYISAGRRVNIYCPQLREEEQTDRSSSFDKRFLTMPIRLGLESSKSNRRLTNYGCLAGEIRQATELSSRLLA